ncbi:response regulator [Pseudoduganella ginsengisoli]|uniref:histidine kinase n=1 Tax=Pseudoduganella ginsengisoli TaxID=1462440 RepID=A0A6L6PWF4_9BURK|nr:ATP-binding protein [Pseudoduganella ginsengisoli]MTW01770.1 response regulator [Pseudoduganella ginsengisoli]
MAVRILIVDDEPAQMRALCDTLGAHGYETVGRSSSEAALQALRADSYHVLLADLMLPGMDGIGLVQAARALDPDLACVIMTGEGSIASAVQAMQVGALDYILKPFRVSVILPVLSRALETRRLRIQNALLEARLREHAVQLVKMNEELRVAQQQADRANQAKSTFLSHLSHELRTPLNAILGFAQILLSEKLASTEAQKKQFAGNILTGARHLLKLSNEVLDLAKIESGRLQLDLEAVPVAGVLEECRILVDPQAQLRGITMRCTCAEHLCVMADRMRLKQVLINLLSNAVKYNRDHGAISVQCMESGQDTVRIAVQDTGLGLTAEQQAALYQPFNRLGQESGKQDGSGLGLVVTKHLVEKMGGELGVASTAGLGSTFWLTLPLGVAPVVIPALAALPAAREDVAQAMPAAGTAAVTD